MRIVFDTNIIVSALISRSGVPAHLIRAWIRGRLTLVSHPRQLDELREVTRREKVRVLIRPAEVGRMFNQILLMAEMPERLPDTQRSADPNDDFLLAMCEAGKADRLVTGDKSGLLVLKRHGPTRIVTAARMAAELGLERGIPG